MVATTEPIAGMPVASTTVEMPAWVEKEFNFVPSIVMVIFAG